MNENNTLKDQLNEWTTHESHDLQPAIILRFWERQRWLEFFRHLDPFMLKLITMVLLPVMTGGLVFFILLNSTGIFTPPKVDPVMDLRLRQKYHKKPLSGTFGLFSDHSKVWLGTLGDGIHQYGFDARIWCHFSRHSTGGLLVGDHIGEIFPDPGYIWLRAGEPNLYGLSVYHIGEKKWQKIIGIQQFAMDGINNITAVEPGEDNITWVGTDRFGLNRYNAFARSWELKHPPLFKIPITSLRNNRYCMLAGTTKGLFSLNSHTSSNPRPNPLNSRNILQVEREPGSGFFYLTTGNEIGRVSKKGNWSFPLIREENNFLKVGNTFIGDKEITAAAMDPRENLWLGTRSMGLAYYNKNRHSWSVFNSKNNENFPSDRIESAAAGPWGAAAGTSKGLFITSHYRDGYSSKKKSAAQMRGYLSYSIPRLEKGENRTHHILWLKTVQVLKKQKLPKAHSSIRKLEFNKKSKEPLKEIVNSTFIGDNLAPGLKENQMTSAVMDKYQQVWVGTLGKGILVYKLSRRDWVAHQWIFEKSKFPDTLYIRNLATDTTGSYVYAVTWDGSLWRFKCREVWIGSDNEKIKPEAIIPSCKISPGTIHDVEISMGVLYFATSKGMTAYNLQKHSWKRLNNRQYIFFQRWDDILYALGSDGNIETIPTFEKVPVPENKKVTEFYIHNGKFLIKTRGGKLFYENQLLIPNTRAMGKDFRTRNIVSVAMDNTGGQESKAWIATKNCLALYDTGSHNWANSSNQFNHIREIYFDKDTLWLHNGQGELYLLEPDTFDILHVFHAIEHVTFSPGKAFAFQRMGNGLRLASFNKDKTVNEIVSSTSFYNVEQQQLSHALWVPAGENRLYLGAGNRLGCYLHDRKRSWLTVTLQGDIRELRANGPVWALTGKNLLYMLNKDLNNVKKVDDVKDFTVTSTGELCFALLSDGGLLKIGNSIQEEIVSSQTAPFNGLPGGKHTICLNEEENRLYFISPDGLSRYNMTPAHHLWKTNSNIDAAHVHFNGTLWAYDQQWLHRVNPNTLKPEKSARINSGTVSFAPGQAIFKTSDFQIQRMRNTGKAGEVLIGEAFQGFNRIHVKQVFIHPKGQFLYFGAYHQDRGAVGRYNVQAHHWQHQTIEGLPKKLVLQQNLLWCLTGQGALYRFDAVSGEFQGSRQLKNVSAITSFENTLVVLQNGQIKTYSPANGEFIIRAFNNYIPGGKIIVRQVVLIDPYILIGTNDQLWKYHIPTHHWTRYNNIAGFEAAYKENTLLKGKKVYTSIQTFDRYAAVLDNEGQFKILDVETDQEVFSEKNVLKFQRKGTFIYLLKPNGLYRYSVPPSEESPAAAIYSKLMGNGESQINQITFIKELGKNLYFGSQDGVVQHYRPATHEWLNFCKTGDAAIRRIEISGGKLLVETAAKQLLVLDRMQIVSKVNLADTLDWYIVNSDIWLNKSGGIYKTEIEASGGELLHPVQIFGIGRSSLTDIRQARQAFRINTDYYFLSNNGILQSYNSAGNNWAPAQTISKAENTNYIVKGDNFYRAYLYNPHGLRFIGASAGDIDVTQIIPVGGNNEAPKIQNFEVTRDAVFVLLNDGRVLHYPHNSPKSRTNPRFIPSRHILVIGEKDWNEIFLTIRRNGDSLWFHPRGLLLYDNSVRGWAQYRFPNPVINYVNVGGRDYLLFEDGKLYLLKREEIPLWQQSWKPNFKAIFEKLSGEYISIHKWQESVIALNEKGKIEKIGKLTIQPLQNFDTHLDLYLNQLLGSSYDKEKQETYQVDSLNTSYMKNSWLIKVMAAGYPLKLRYNPDWQEKFVRWDNIVPPEPLPKASPGINIRKWRGTGYFVRRIQDRITGITVADGKLVYRMARAPYSQNHYYSFAPSNPVGISNASDFNRAQRLLETKRNRHTTAIIQPNGRVKLADYSTSLTPQGEWAHDHYFGSAYSRKPTSRQRIYMFSDAGVIQYTVTSGSNHMQFTEYFPYDRFLTASGLDNEWQWAKNGRRIERKDRFQWVNDTTINGFGLKISSQVGGPRIRLGRVPGNNLSWNRSFLWDTIHDFGVDGNNRIWVSHPGAVVLYDDNNITMENWLWSAEVVKDIYFKSSGDRNQPLGYCRRGSQHANIPYDFDKKRQWTNQDNGEVYRIMQTLLAENGSWKFLRWPVEENLRVYYRNQSIYFQEGGRFGFDRVNDLIEAPTGKLLWMTDDGLFDGTTNNLERFGSPSHLKITGARYHPSYNNNNKILLYMNRGVYSFHPNTPGRVERISDREIRQIHDLLSRFEHKSWNFKNSGWQYNGHNITFNNGRFGFDRVVHLVADPVVFLTPDGIWQYENGIMSNWLSARSFHRQGRKVYRSHFDRNTVYLESRNQLFQLHFDPRQGLRLEGPKTSSLQRNIIDKETSIATDRAYKKWHFPAVTGPGTKAYLTNQGQFKPVTFNNGRFGFDTINDLEWNGNQLHLITYDGLVRWDINEGKWQLYRHLGKQKLAPVDSIYKNMALRGKSWSPPPDNSGHRLENMKIIFKNPVDNNIYICQESLCTGMGYIFDQREYHPYNNTGSKWQEKQSTLLAQGYKGPWQFIRTFKTVKEKKKPVVSLRLKNNRNNAPVTFKRGRFGFNRFRLLSANSNGLLLITDESREVFKFDGNSNGFHISPEVETFQHLTVDKFEAANWLVQTDSGYLYSKNGEQFPPLPSATISRAKDLFERRIISDKIYVNWKFLRTRGFQRKIQEQGQWVPFHIDNGRMNFDSLSPGTVAYTLAIEEDDERLWYVTPSKNAICISTKGKILYDFHPELTTYPFDHIYYKRWQDQEATLLGDATTSNQPPKRWNPAQKRWESPPPASEPEYEQFKDTLIKQHNWEFIRTTQNSPLQVRVMAANQHGNAYVPLVLDTTSGFIADQVNALAVTDKKLYLATNDGLRILALNSTDWPSHTYLKTSPQYQKIQDIKLNNNLPWLRCEDRTYYLHAANQWLPAEQNIKHSPFEQPQITTTNWNWHLKWQNQSDRYTLNLLSPQDNSNRRIYSEEGNFTDNLVKDFDASYDTILVSSEAGVTLYKQDGKRIKHFPQFPLSRVLYQGGKWHIKASGNQYFSISSDLALESSRAIPFYRQRQTTGWATWYKNLDNKFSFELHRRPLATKTIFSKSGRFNFDEILQLIVANRSLWALTSAGILHYNTGGKNSLPCTSYFPRRISPPVYGIELNPGELYFVSGQTIITAGKIPETIPVEEIHRRTREKKIKSKDRLWIWRKLKGSFVIQYKDIPELTRSYSNGRFEDDQPLSLLNSEQAICYKTLKGWFILEKQSLRPVKISSHPPREYKSFLNNSVYQWEKNLLELKKNRIYLNNDPFTPESLKLNLLFKRKKSFWAMDKKYFYKINLKGR